MKAAMEIERPPKPILSSYAADPELEERISAFVVQMGERIDYLQDADIDGDLDLSVVECGEHIGRPGRRP